MATKTKTIDWGGLTVLCREVLPGYDSPGGANNAVVAAAATTLTREAYANRVISLGATGVAQTLPAATGTGDAYKFILGATVSSGSHTIVCAGTDEFAGVIYQTDTDSSDALVAYPAVAGDDYDTITLNGSTTGGLQGDWIEIVDVASGVWALRGDTRGTGSVATPLSSA